mgnify:CR=1 FL=1
MLTTGHRRAGLLADCLCSTRAMAASQCCSSQQGFDPLSPLSWGEECGLGVCPSCPAWRLHLPQDREGEVVTLHLWGDKFCPIKGKKVLRLV